MRGQVLPMSASALRRELSARNQMLARDQPHECTFGSVPSILYRESEGLHGNFHPASYREIAASPEWSRRLQKSYAAGKWVPRRWDRIRFELDCATSSDALLMNIFCHPGLLAEGRFCTLMGIDRGLRPCFGFKPKLPLINGSTDQTEIDMALGPLLIEAKLTETGFQKAPIDRVLRYRSLHEVFAVDELPISGSSLLSYQLIRGVLSAHHFESTFVVFCDARRADLMEAWFRVMRAVVGCELRSRLALLTWQELASVVPLTLRLFLEEKYGIFAD